MPADDKTPWYERDELWERMGQVMFGDQRMEMAVEEVDMLINLLDMSTEDRILDLCCGIGRHSNELARRGYSVTGVDRTKSYLEIARGTAKNEDLSTEFVQKDMREFVRENSFDVVLSMFTSFGYFDDDSQQMTVLDNVSRSLRPGGRFIIETIGKEVLARIFQEADWSEGDYGIHLERRRPTDDWGKMQNTWILIAKDGTRHEWNVTHYLYSAFELKSLLRSAGFEDVRAYGGLDGSTYDNTSRRLAVVGVKKE
ncbi:MAG: class I SAM-dependent methyltransferase [Candidatus Thorarchaeota archaeon]